MIRIDHETLKLIARALALEMKRHKEGEEVQDPIEQAAELIGAMEPGRNASNMDGFSFLTGYTLAWAAFDLTLLELEEGID